MNRFRIFLVAAALIAVAGLTLVGYRPHTVKAQSGCTVASMSGPYVYKMKGFYYDSAFNLYIYGAVGRWIADGNGALSGSETVSGDGQIVRRTFTATYTMNADCTGSATVTNSDGTSAHVDLIVTPTLKQVDVIVTDGSNIITGVANSQN